MIVVHGSLFRRKLIRYGADSSAFVVSVSGVTPEDPVVSRKSGLLFERRLIVKHLAVCFVLLYGFSCPSFDTGLYLKWKACFGNELIWSFGYCRIMD